MLCPSVMARGCAATAECSDGPGREHGAWRNRAPKGGYETLPGETVRDLSYAISLDTIGGDPGRECQVSPRIQVNRPLCGALTHASTNRGIRRGSALRRSLPHPSRG